jgi:hypothetical protein
MIIHVQFRFSQLISFREEDLWNFGQSENIIGLGSHIEYPTGTKNSNFVEDHRRNIPAKFDSNRPSGFGEEVWNVKSLQTTDDRQQTTDDGRQVKSSSLCLYTSNLGTFWLKIKQFWQFEEISIFSNGGHLGYRTALTDTILKGDHIRIISAKFSWDWLNSFREDFF